jgi:hypothetical protein
MIGRTVSWKTCLANVATVLKAFTTLSMSARLRVTQPLIAVLTLLDGGR